MSEAFLIPTLDALDLTAVIDIYQTQRAMMPNAVPGGRRQRRALIDILDEFDGLILDGYGVINVGANLVAGIEDLLQVAAERDKPVVVLTNGSSFESSVAVQKYAKWRLQSCRMRWCRAAMHCLPLFAVAPGLRRRPRQM